MNSWTYRCLFRTQHGRIGLGSSTLEIDHSVWMLSGGRVPFVLRKVVVNNDSRYDLVGEAYVHGMMYGEAVKDLRPEDWKDVVIQ